MVNIEIPEPITAVIDEAINFVYSFGPMSEKTVVLGMFTHNSFLSFSTFAFLKNEILFFLLVPEFVKAQAAAVADMAGMDTETVSYVLGMLLCYPLGLIMNAIPYGKARHLFSFLFGAFLLQFVLGVQWIHHIITSLVAYAMIVTLPRKTLTQVLPTFAITYCVLGHLHRQYINYLGWDLDFTGTQMVITQTLYMVAWNLYDGERLAQGKEDRAAKKLAAFALKDTPSLLEFLGYTFCFSNLLAGPATEFSTYQRAIDGTIFNTPSGKRCKAPSNVAATLVPFFTSFICLGFHLYLIAMFPLLNPDNPQTGTPFILTEEFLAKPWFQRYFHSWMGLFATREKYYFGWKNAQGACNIWYSGFDGMDEEGKPIGWETANNMNVIGFETAQDVQSSTKEWNIKTSNWLTRYVYFRTGGSLFAVYSLSAFWHGFYPGYYFFFLSVPLPTMCHRMAKKKLSPYFSKSKFSLYGLVCFFATTIVMNYMILAFMMLAFDWSLAVYKSNYFFGHIACILGYIVLSILPTPKSDKKKKIA